MSGVITLTISSDEDEDNNFKDKNRKVKPVLPISNRLNHNITITKVSPKQQIRKERDKIEVKKLSRTPQSSLDFQKIKIKYSFGSSKNNNVNKNEVPKVFKTLWSNRDKAKKLPIKLPEVVDIDEENEKATSQSLINQTDNGGPKIVDVKSIAPIAKETKQKNLSELICALVEVPAGSKAFTQKTEVLEKEKSPQEKCSVRNPFSVLKKDPPPLASIIKLPKNVHKNSGKNIRLSNFSENKKCNGLPAVMSVPHKHSSDKNLKNKDKKEHTKNKIDDDVEIVSLETEENGNEIKDGDKAVVEDKLKSDEEKLKRKRESSNELEEKVKKTKEDNIELEAKVKKKEDKIEVVKKDKKKDQDSDEHERKPKKLKIDVSEIYQEFFNLAKSIEKNPGDRERMSTKLTKYYNRADPSYTNSNDFKKLLETSVQDLKREPLKLYFVLKNVLEDLNCRKEIKFTKKKLIPTPLSLNPDKKEILKEFVEPEEFQPIPVISKKNEKHVNRLAKTIKKLKKKVKELEEAEVDLDDEENSTYFKMQKYRERLCLVYKKYCQYTGDPPDAGRTDKAKIGFSGTKIPSVNKCITRWLNKTKQFPDFIDILKLITEVNEKEELNMTTDKIKTVAETAFREVGKQLQRKRQYDLYESYSSFLDAEEDPADSDPSLNAALKRNQEEYTKKVEDLINFYAEKQGNAKGEEVPDDEADGSAESDDPDEKEIEEVENGLKEESSEDDEEDKKLKNGHDKAEENSVPPETTDKSSSPTSENLKNDEASTKTPQAKESKNNYKHCKSLKWRLENNTKLKSDLCNGDDNSVSDSKAEDNLNCLTNDEKCEESVEENLKLVEDDKPKTDLDATETDAKKDEDCEIIELRSPRSKFDIGLKKTSFLVNYVSVEHSFKSHENNFINKLKSNKFRDKTLGFALNDLTNLNGFDFCKDRGRKNFKFFTKKSHKENLNPILRANYKFRNQRSVFKLSCKKGLLGGLNCTLENKENDIRVNGSEGKGEERENEREEDVGSQENENSSGSGNGDGNNNNDDGDDENGREKAVDEEGEENEEEDDKEKEEEDCANGNYDAETDSESQGSKDECKDDGEVEESVGEKGEAGMETDEEEKCEESEKEGEMSEEGEGESGGRGGEEESKEENEEEVQEGGEDTKEPEEEKENEEMDEGKGERVKEDESEESNCSAGTEHGEIKEGDNVTEKTKVDVKIEVKREEDEEDGKTELKTEEVKQENEDSEEQSKELAAENSEALTNKNENEEEANEENGGKEEERNEEANEEIGEKEEEKSEGEAKEENGEKEEEDETKDENAESLELTCESDHEEAGPSTGKRKDYIDTGDSSDVEVIDVKKPKFTSDEELVKNFLQHSPSSISITPPRKSQSKPPSAEALQALATLRQLKSISTTRVRRRRNEAGDLVEIRDPPPPRPRNNFVNNVPTPNRIRPPIPQNRNRGGLPVISNVQSINRNRQSNNNLTPKIVTVQGNVSNFYNRSNNFGFPNTMNNMIPGFNHFPRFNNNNNNNNQFNNFSMFNNRQPQSSLKISNVRGNISFGPQPQVQRRFANPTTTFRLTAPSSSSESKDKNKKPVEYVVLE